MLRNNALVLEKVTEEHDSGAHQYTL